MIDQENCDIAGAKGRTASNDTWLVVLVHCLQACLLKPKRLRTVSWLRRLRGYPTDTPWLPSYPAATPRLPRGYSPWPSGYPSATRYPLPCVLPTTTPRLTRDCLVAYPVAIPWLPRVLPRSYPVATPRLPRGYPGATPQLPRGYPAATTQALSYHVAPPRATPRPCRSYPAGYPAATPQLLRVLPRGHPGRRFGNRGAIAK